MKTIIKILVLFLIVFVSCSKNDNPQTKVKQLTIFFVNDVHGQIDNFSKIKHIIDLEKQKTNVIIASSGDLFSGNPIVDNSVEKGYPMVDLMNRLEFDIAVLGNHEFDYGIDILKQRNEQANFDWICANVNSGNTSMPQPEAYKTIEKEDLKITFLGLVETNGKQNGTIPSAHPWKMEGLTFERPENVIDQYSNIKSLEGSDLYIALSHLGYGGSGKILGDVTLAEQYPWFDLIIGGHSHQIINTTINNIPIFQSGSYLHNLGKIELTIKNKKIKSYNFELIDLDKYQEFDPEIKTIIDEYNELPYLTDIIGYSNGFHDKSAVGCFYADALRVALNVDISFQNTGGIRANLDEGDITKREIFEISPFNNGTVIFEMTIKEIKDFMKGSGSGFYFSGILVEQIEREIEIWDTNGKRLPDQAILKVGINDYIPAVHDFYFQMEGKRQLLSDAETIIYYLENIYGQVEYQNSNCYFRFN